MTLNYTLEELAGIIGAEKPVPEKAGIRFHAVSTDSRTIRPGEVFFALSGERFDGNRFVADAFAKGAAAAVCRNPAPGGICLLTADPLEALQRLASYHRTRSRATVIAITGSCGKTTTKNMLREVLEGLGPVAATPGNLNNEIGCPLSLLQIDADSRFAVIEMGANHKGEIRRLCEMATPDESMVTLVAPAHLEGFGSIEEVALTKEEIREGLHPGGVFYTNIDNPYCAAMGERHTGPVVRFGSDHRADVRLMTAERLPDGRLRAIIEPIGELLLNLPVRAQLTSVLACAAVGLRHGLPDLKERLEVASARADRMRIRRIGPLTVLDDTYNANPASMRAALEALVELCGTGGRAAALGSMFELGSDAPALHREIGALAARLGVERLYVLGPNAQDYAAGAHDAGMVRVLECGNHEDMAQAVIDDAKPGDTLLVKGSRGTRMEQLISRMVEHWGETEKANIPSSRRNGDG